MHLWPFFPTPCASAKILMDGVAQKSDHQKLENPKILKCPKTIPPNYNNYDPEPIESIDVIFPWFPNDEECRFI